jgi:hypothetical protein
MTSIPILILSAVTLTGVTGCQGSDLTLPGDGSPNQLEAVSGFDQEATVGTEVPQPLVARLTDGAGQPIANAALRFQTDVPAARLDPAQVFTDARGFAQTRARLGMQEGTQTFEAVLAEVTGSEVRTTFDLVGLPGQPPRDDEDGDNNGDDDNGDNDNRNDDNRNDDNRNDDNRNDDGDRGGQGNDDDDDGGRGGRDRQGDDDSGDRDRDQEKEKEKDKDKDKDKD